jgi:hypothetical protein
MVMSSSSKVRSSSRRIIQLLSRSAIARLLGGDGEHHTHQIHRPRGLMAKALDFGLHLLNSLEIPGSTPGVVDTRSSDLSFCKFLHLRWVVGERTASHYKRSVFFSNVL